MSDDVDGRPHEKASEKMNCEDVGADLDAYLDGELEADSSAERAAAFKTHLASCEECLARLQRRKALVGLVQALPVPRAPAGLVDRIFIETSRTSRPERSRFRLRTWVPALAAAAVVLLAAVIGLRSSREGRVPHIPLEDVRPKMAREAEEYGRAPILSRGEPEPSLDMVAAKVEAEAPREGLPRGAAAERRRKDVGEARVLEKAPLRKAAPEPAAPVLAEAPAAVMKTPAEPPAREVALARDAAHGVADEAAPPAAEGALRFEKKKAAAAPRRPGRTSPRAARKAKERAVAAKAAPRPKSYRARSARRATGGQYRPKTRTWVAEGGERSSGEELQQASEARQSVVIPQVHRIARQAAVGPSVLRAWQDAAGRGEEVLVLTSGVTAERVATAGGGAELFIKVPLVTSDPIATQIRLVTMARDLGGEFVKGISPRGGRLDGPGVPLALTNAAEERLEGERARLKRQGVRSIPRFPLKRRDLKVVVRIPGEGWNRFLSRIGLAGIARDGKPAGAGIRIPRLSYKALYRGGVATATVEFALISPEELAVKAKAEAKTRARAKASRAAFEALETGAQEPPAGPCKQ